MIAVVILKAKIRLEAPNVEPHYIDLPGKPDRVQSLAYGPDAMRLRYTVVGVGSFSHVVSCINGKWLVGAGTRTAERKA